MFQTLVLRGCGDESRGSQRKEGEKMGRERGGGGGGGGLLQSVGGVKGGWGSMGVGHVTSYKSKMLFLIENKMSLSHTQAKCFFSFFMRGGGGGGGDMSHIL